MVWILNDVSMPAHIKENFETHVIGPQGADPFSYIKFQVSTIN